MTTLFNLVQWDPEILENLPLPEGIESDLLADTMLFEYGSYDVIFYEPKVFRYMLERWCKRKWYTLETLYKTMFFEYDPIENYRRYEDGWTEDERTLGRTSERNGTNENHEVKKDTNVVDRTENTTGKDIYSETGADKRTGDSTRNKTGNADTHNSVSAENSESWLNDTKSEVDTSEKETIQTNENGSNSKDYTLDKTGKVTGKENGTFNGNTDVNGSEQEKTEENENEGNSGKYGSLAHGNIGVTTTQQMIEQEREAAKFDFYKTIADMWAKDFCVCVSW